jgi:myo-inositol-1(or 4)-monophosphatase
MKQSIIQPSQNLKIALDTMDKAITFFNSQKLKVPVVLDQNAKELKLDLDIQLEKIITKSLQSATPYAVLGEENGLLGSGLDALWVIDPLDGTYNFSRNLQPYCISIGLMFNGQPQLGVIYDVSTNHIFYGEKGFGAFCNGEIINVSNKPLEQAALATGFPVGFQKSDLENWYEIIERFKKIRMYGSACYSLLQVAQGKIDSYFEKGIFLWDVAAGLAIVEAAGGKYSIEPTPKEFKLNIYAGNSDLYEWFKLKNKAVKS